MAHYAVLMHVILGCDCCSSICRRAPLMSLVCPPGLRVRLARVTGPSLKSDHVSSKLARVHCGEHASRHPGDDFGGLRRLLCRGGRRVYGSDVGPALYGAERAYRGRLG